jgi:hypothetical protein
MEMQTMYFVIRKLILDLLKVCAECRPLRDPTSPGLLRRVFVQVVEVTNDSVISKLYDVLPENLRENALLLADVMGIPVNIALEQLPVAARSQAAVITAMSPWVRSSTLTSLMAEIIIFAANKKPIVIIFEDIHFWDKSSLSLLPTMIDACNNALYIVVSRSMMQVTHSLAAPVACRTLVSPPRLQPGQE